MKSSEDKLVPGSLWYCTVYANYTILGNGNAYFYITPWQQYEEKLIAEIIEADYQKRIIKIKFLRHQTDITIENFLEYFEPQEEE